MAIKDWDWEKIIDRILRGMLFLLLAWFAYNVYEYWGTIGAAGFANAFIWCGMYWLQLNLGRDWRDLSAQGLKGWREALESNDKCMEMIKKAVEENVRLRLEVDAYKAKENAKLKPARKPTKVRKLRVKSKR